MSDRLETAFWLKAAIKRWNDRGISMLVVRRGEATAGAVLVKINRGRDIGCMVLAQTRTPQGQPAWLRGTGAEPVTEDEADAYIARQLKYDPDLWVVEIEDAAGRHPFEEPIL
jgi:hypothetical protein